MALQDYHRKRRFSATPEPRGAAGKARGKSDAPGFVVQLHHARARHYDFRLEVDGVLRSWAVPKGPSLRAGEKRLAVQVEDHPLDYAGFAGTIPEGNYGAGHVAIFDQGTWQPDGDAAAAIARGKLEFALHGQRLKGRWTLVRTGKPASKPQWLLLKRSDEYAADLEADDLLEAIPPPPADAPGASTARGRRILADRDAVAPAAKKAATLAHAQPKPKPRPKPEAGVARAALRAVARRLAGSRRLPPDQFVAPMLTTAAEAPPAGEQWLHEWKWDGYRIIAQASGAPRLWSRNGLDWSARLPELLQALADLGIDALLDGELIAVDARGYSDFNALQHALKHGDTAQLRYAVFDLLALAGHDLRAAPLLARKELLEQLLHGADPRLFYSGHVEGHGADVFEAARSQGMEGIISKRADSAYASGRSAHWRKIKAVETREFVVVGYTQPKGSRQGIGALLLAQMRDGALVYAGRVGSGLSDMQLREMARDLKAREVESPTLALPPHTPLPAGNVRWVRPELVVEVVFRGWGKEGLLRQASFHRVRPDTPVSAELEQAEPKSAVKPEAPKSKRATRTKAAAKRPAPSRAAAKPRSPPRTSVALPTLSSPERVVYPDAGITKRDVFDYYLAAADQILDEIGGRLLSIVRCPDGIAGQHFFQKHAGPGFGESVRRHVITENDGDQATYFSVDDVAGLMNLVQMNAIELHPWGSKVDTLEQPDRLVFDLDPDVAIGWSEVKAAARDVRDRLAETGLASYPRLSGGKGVHVVAPIAPHADWAQVRRFCEAFADAMAQGQPQRYVATMSKAKREGRIFIDWLRNGRGATAIASWSLRARPGAPVAMPLTWEELARVRQPGRYTIKNAAARELPAFVAAMTARAPALPL
ncbi:DNA ligase D [Lysobacter koreensis]|uniref:DNA ligase (ATP) n=1 Tax=Lysobacter koreensis TaxID=266122 RepID=A0ABW2YM13_9GAMM